MSYNPKPEDLITVSKGGGWVVIEKTDLPKARQRGAETKDEHKARMALSRKPKAPKAPKWKAPKEDEE